MAALVCDLCGGRLIMGAGGIATCDSCGMEHSADRMKEKIQEIKGVVQVDNTHLIDNYMRMAQNAYNSNNKEEAENYCNKIIEIAPTHQQAWLLKGRAAGWQSTLSNIRFSEAINCFANAIEYTDKEGKEAIIDECQQEVKELAEALLRLRGERFAKWPDEEEKAGFYNDLTAVLQAILQFFETVGSLINKDELMAPLATIIHNSVMNAWNNVVRPTFGNDHNGHPDDYELKRLIVRAGHCTDLLERAINLSESDFENDIQCYTDLIAIHWYLINAQSYSYETVHVRDSNWDGSPIYENKYVKSKSLTDEAKRQRRQLITTYEAKIKAGKRDVFWSGYSNEHTFLNKELDKSKTECDKLLKSNTSHTKIERIKKHILEIETILERDRELTSKIEQSEKRFIENCEAFWEKLSSDDGKYDAYLDQNPILKRAPEFVRRHDQLLRERQAIENEKKSNSPGALIILLLLFVPAVFMIIMAPKTTAPDSFAIWGWIGAILWGIPVCISCKNFLGKKVSIRDKEKNYAKAVLEYNATVDEMHAVPKYEGHVDDDAKVKIPSRL